VSTAQQTAIDAKVGGTVGSTTDRLVKSSGTGAKTLQATGITVDSSNNVSGISTVDASSYILANQFITGDNQVRVQSNNGLLLGSAMAVRAYNNAAPNAGTADCDLRRNATGPKWIAAADGGLEVRNFARNADAPLTCSSITLSAAHNLAPITKTALLLLTPTAASAGRWRVTDATPANREAYPDGTNWRYTSDDTVVT
jgi:hypothetical protein